MSIKKSLILITALSFIAISCSQRSAFSAKSTIPNSSNGPLPTVDDAPFGQVAVDNNGNTLLDGQGNTIYIDVNGNYFTTDTNGNKVPTDINGNPLTQPSPQNPILGIVRVEGRVSPGQPGETVVINFSSPGANCGQWMTYNEVHNIHMNSLLQTATQLEPLAGIVSPEIYADEASLDRTCYEIGCGQALEVYTREYASPYNNTIVRWISDRWVKEGAKWNNERNNIKIGNKKGNNVLRCDAPGVFTSGNIKMYHTD